MLILGQFGKPVHSKLNCILTDTRVNGANNNVTKACDFIGHDGYPYWQGASPQQASEVFWKSVEDTINSAWAVNVSEAEALLTDTDNLSTA
jgi:exo-beta-1,3-glucanase (GH17 family)